MTAPRKPDVPAAAIAVAYDAAGEPIPPAVMKRILDAVWPLAAAAAVRAGQCADDQPSGGPGQAIEISEPGPCAFTREQLVRVLQTPSVTGALAMIEEQGGCPADLADAILESHICRDCLTGHIHVLAPETGP